MKWCPKNVKNNSTSMRNITHLYFIVKSDNQLNEGTFSSLISVDRSEGCNYQYKGYKDCMKFKGKVT